MPSFSSIKFGLELAGCFLAAIFVFLAFYWKLNEIAVNKELHKQ